DANRLTPTAVLAHRVKERPAEPPPAFEQVCLVVRGRGLGHEHVPQGRALIRQVGAHCRRRRELVQRNHRAEDRTQRTEDREQFSRLPPPPPVSLLCPLPPFNYPLTQRSPRPPGAGLFLPSGPRRVTGGRPRVPAGRNPASSR